MPTVCPVRPRVEALLQRVGRFASAIESINKSIPGNGRTPFGKSNGEQARQSWDGDKSTESVDANEKDEHTGATVQSGTNVWAWGTGEEETILLQRDQPRGSNDPYDQERGTVLLEE